MTAIWTIAHAELRIGLRNRWVAMAIALLATLALALAFAGSAPSGTLGVDRLTLTVVSLASLSVYLVPLIALLLAYDAIVGEVERGTLALLLTYPLGRAQLIAGKFLGHTAILALATVLGYGVAGVALLAWQGAEAAGVWSFARLIGSSVALGAAFLALGYLISASVRASGTAAGLAIAAWLALVLIYDLGLLGALVADQDGAITRELFPYLLLANPTDSYRLLNLSGIAGVELLSGMGGISDQLAVPPGTLLAVLAAWVAVPLALAALRLERREL